MTKPQFEGLCERSISKVTIERSGYYDLYLVGRWPYADTKASRCKRVLFRAQQEVIRTATKKELKLIKKALDAQEKKYKKWLSAWSVK